MAYRLELQDERRYIIDPVPAPRQNVRSRFNPSKMKMIARYHAFCDHARLLRIAIPDACYLRFEMPVPKRGKHRIGQPHQQRPDLDNLEKALLDAVFKEDAHIHTVFKQKVWALQGAIVVGTIVVEEMEG